MSAPQIKADYDQLVKIAQRFSQESESMQLLLDRISQAVETLQNGDWLGEGAILFYREMDDDIIPSIKRLCSALQQAGQATVKICATMQQAENDAALLLKIDDDNFLGAKSEATKTNDSSGLLDEVGDALGSILSGAGDFVKGMWDEGADMVGGLWHLATTNPIDLAIGLGYAATHPGAVFDALAKPYVDAWESGHPWQAIGRGTLFIGTLFIGAGEAGAAAKSASAGAKVAEAAELAAKAAKAAETAELAAKAAKAAEAAELAAKAAKAAEVAELAAKVAEETRAAEAAASASKAAEEAKTVGDLSKGGAANAVGIAREQRVAELVGGKVSAGEEVIAKGIGKTDIDVIGPAGELIAVGGPAKAKDLGKLGTQLKKLKVLAAERGVPAIAYFEANTPEKVIEFAIKRLGKDNVKVFSMPK